MSRADPSAHPRARDAAQASLSAVAADWLQAAIPSLANVPLDRDATVHDSRTATKRARALLRLFSQALGRSTVRRSNRALRDAARALGHARDAAVVRTVLLKLQRKHRGRKAAAIASALQGLADQPPVVFTAAQTRVAIAHAHRTLRSTVRRLRRLRLTLKEAAAEIATGLRTSYRRCRHQMQRAQAAGDAAEFHEWRKLTKRLYYQLQFPGLTQSNGGRNLIRQLDHLQERLGGEHDTWLAEALIRSEPAWFGGTKATSRVLAALVQRRKKLRKRCLRLGRRAFADKPEAFAATIRRQLRR